MKIVINVIFYTWRRHDPLKPGFVFEQDRPDVSLQELFTAQSRASSPEVTGNFLGVFYSCWDEEALHLAFTVKVSLLYSTHLVTSENLHNKVAVSNSLTGQLRSLQ